MTTIECINGKLTRREIVRRIARRALAEEGSPIMPLAYLARRFNYTVAQTKYFLTYCKDVGIVDLVFVRDSVVFAC